MSMDILPQKEFMKALVDNTPVAYIILDKSFRILYMNDYFLKLRHLDKAKTRGELCYNLSNAGVPCTVCAVASAQKTGNNTKLLRRDTLPDGTVRYIDDYAFPLRLDGREGYTFEIMVNRTSEMLLRDQIDSDFKEIIITLSSLLESKDEYTATHSASVRTLSEKIAKAMNLVDREVYDINIAAALHDIGKVSIPLSILNKPAGLDEDEFTTIKTHPVKSFDMIESLYGFEKVKEIVLYHHERFDGKGYPKGLAGEEIPLGARIVAVSDTYDAMTSTRSYRTALPHEVAVKEILKNSGTQFDPQVVEAFLTINPSSNVVQEDVFQTQAPPKQVERVIKPMANLRAPSLEPEADFSSIVEEGFINEIIANTPALYAIFDRQGEFVYTSDSFLEFFGSAEAFGPAAERRADRRAKEAQNAVARAFYSKQLEIDTLVQKETPGGVRYIDVYAIPFLNDVSPEYIIQIIFDRTEEVRLQNQHERDFSRLIKILSDTLDYHAAGAANLSQVVGEVTAVLAQAAGLDETDQRDIVFAAYLCNIGLISLYDAAGHDEMNEALYQQHPVIAYNILKKLSGFAQVKEVALYHHEKFSGGGFPSGLSGRSIPLGSRIVAVADAFCHETERGKTPEEAVEKLKADAGVNLDPDIVALLERTLQQ